ncbi:L-asparaginase (EC, partial [uncultured Gammaproteobacteria bacterium]
MKIKVLITGGTIDKAYNTSTGKLAFVETHIIDMLNRSRSMAETLSEVLFLKDSLEITHDNRALILS